MLQFKIYWKHMQHKVHESPWKTINNTKPFQMQSNSKRNSNKKNFLFTYIIILNWIANWIVNYRNDFALQNIFVNNLTATKSVNHVRA